MESKRKLKLIPLHQFFKIMDWPGKVLYLILFLALAGSAVGMVLAFDDPSRWVVSVEEFHTTELEEVQLREYDSHYRKMHTEIGAWKEDVTFFATPMTPKSWIVYAFIACQVLGWAYLLTAASYIKNFIAYALYFLYAMAIFLSRAFEAIAPDQSMLFNVGMAVLVFAPAYLFQQNILNWRFALRLPIFLVVTALPFVVSFIAKDWVGLHSATVGMFPLLAFIAILYFIFISKDLSQLMFFAGTNLRNPNLRARFPIFLAVFLVIAALELIMLQEVMGWELIPMKSDFPLRPAYLLALVTLLMPGLNQNLSFVAKDYIDNRSFTVLITSIGLIAVSGLFLNAALGEYIFVHTMERLLALLFFVAGILHFFYIFYNFGPLIRAKVNFYFISMMPKRLMYFFVVAATVLLSLAVEASEGMKTQRLLQTSAFNRNADQEMLEGDFEEAIALYLAAKSSAAGTVKGNYNQAMLLMRVEGDLDVARECLRDASSFIPFAPAWINLGNLEMDGGTVAQAKYYLNQGWAQIQDPYLANNLAQAHVLLDEPDSAILAMKHALRMQPENPSFYSNMGRIYMDYGKPEAAKDFLAAGLALPNPGPAVTTNALFLNMKLGTDLKVPEDLLAKEDIGNSRSATFNFAVERYKGRDYDGASKLLDTLLRAAETPDALLLDGMLRFERGDVEGAISRMAYMDVNFAEYKKFTNHFLGVAFFSAGVPEMAAEYFQKSVENGRRDDALNQARMEIDRGDHEFGFILLNMARQQDSTLFDAVAREEALLQVARGEYFFAGLGFDLGSLTPSEWTRAGIYSGQEGNRPAALEAFRHALDIDSTFVAPYLEMGRISIRLGDSLAAENLDAGLKIQPKNLPMRVERARAELIWGSMAEAYRMEAALQKEAPEEFLVQRLKAEFSAVKGDTTSAIEQYKALHKAHPMDHATTIALARLMRAKRLDYEGQNMLADVLAINPRNTDYWYEMAQFERLLNRSEEVAKAALAAISLEPNPERGKRIAEEFKAEMDAHPEALTQE